MIILDYLFTWSAVRKPWNPDRWMKADPQCGYNTLQSPEGSTPLHEIFEEYAEDQQKWLDEFVPTLEKMLNNGYEE